MKRIASLAIVMVAVAACGGNSVKPTVETTPEPTETLTEAPVATIPPGVGEIAFGLDYDPDTLEIIKPTVRFKATFGAIAYSASLMEAANAATLRIVIASISTSGSERIIVDEDVSVSNPAADLFANKVDLAGIVGNKPGDYVMRFLRDATVLAEGTFTLVK